MKRVFVAIAMMLCTLVASAQTVCGPVYPVGRSQNPDGTWTITGHANCQVPDPASWSHTYTFEFPQIIPESGMNFHFVGSAVAYVQGDHDAIGRAVRWVRVNTATITDAQGNNYQPVESTVYPNGTRYPEDQWTSTVPFASDILYSFAVSGTDTIPNGTVDTLVISAVYTTGDE